MSRRSQRNSGSTSKRKNCNDVCDCEDEPSAKIAEILSEEQTGREEKETTELQENADNTKQESITKDDLRPHFTAVQKKAIEARRRLDSVILQRRQTMGFKDYIAYLQGDLKKINQHLYMCHKSNVRLEREMKELKSSLVIKSKPRCRPKKQPTANKAAKPSPRQQTLVVLPSSNSDDTKVDLRDVLGEPKQIDGADPKPVEIDHDGDQPSDTCKPNYLSDGNVTFIALNNEEDYPDGSWLGDEENPQLRVRVHISPGDMIHVTSMYKSADKVALKMIDLLFDKETQATSNISGTGKHGKKKLDPLFMFGIHCHLVKHYSITAEDWHRIKLNIDSKCRTAFRRKLKGLALYPKEERKIKRSRGDFSQQVWCRHLQQMVNQLQTLPLPEGGLPGITIIQEQADGTTRTVDPGAAGSLVGHAILHHQGGEIHADQIKEVCSSEIHLSNGQTIAISQIGELEVQEVDVIKDDEEPPESRVISFHPGKKTEKDCALDC